MYRKYLKKETITSPKLGSKPRFLNTRFMLFVEKKDLVISTTIFIRTIPISNVANANKAFQYGYWSKKSKFIDFLEK
jgi:hypothetical protein